MITPSTIPIFRSNLYFDLRILGNNSENKINNNIPKVRESKLPMALSGSVLLFKIKDINPPYNVEIVTHPNTNTPFFLG